MKESYSEILAKNAGPESYAVDGNIGCVVTAGVQLGAAIELRKHGRSERRRRRAGGRQHDRSRYGRGCDWFGGVEELMHGWKPQAREPGDPTSLSKSVIDSDPKTPQEVQRI